MSSSASALASSAQSAPTSLGSTARGRPAGSHTPPAAAAASATGSSAQPASPGLRDSARCRCARAARPRPGSWRAGCRWSRPSAARAARGARRVAAAARARPHRRRRPLDTPSRRPRPRALRVREPRSRAGMGNLRHEALRSPTGEYRMRWSARILHYPRRRPKFGCSARTWSDKAPQAYATVREMYKRLGAAQGRHRALYEFLVAAGPRQ